MSMPITCTKHSVSIHSLTKENTKENTKERQIPMLISKILMTVNAKHILPFCASSIHSICREYAISENDSTIQYIVDLINTNTLSHTDSLAVFFLLLNVDTVLKENMFLSESEAQKSKLSNFFMNLRKNIIPDYMAQDHTRCNAALGTLVLCARSGAYSALSAQ